MGEAVNSWAADSSPEARGAVFTRGEVVGFILDLVGYVADAPLHQLRILEPSFGRGDFLLPMVERLLSSWRRHGGQVCCAEAELGEAVRGVELHRETFLSTCRNVVERLVREGISASAASGIVSRWLTQGDFLLERQNTRFDFVVGNPPYVRPELIPAPLLTEYRRRYRTMYDRADLYVPFMERALSLLKPGGILGFICADRWMKNRYGGPLRKLVADDFHLRIYVDMVETRAFHTDVSAYPAITVIAREGTGSTRTVRRPAIEKGALAALASELRAPTLSEHSLVREVSGIVDGSAPWLLESFQEMPLIRRLESRFPTLEQAGCKVGIGVATGADKVFVGDFASLDVEADRKLPLVSTRDILSGEVVWQGRGVINPFDSDGGLVDLRKYPRLARYLESHRTVIAGRHCARKSPSHWYRTIDRIWPALASRPKLLIPDIKGEAHVVFEPGTLYPHHNLYHVTSDEWDLRALQAVLLSSVARLFVDAYSVRMRGGCLRFQAQYLRRIHIPFWKDVPEPLRKELRCGAVTRDLGACDRAVFQLYHLNRDECSVLAGREDRHGH